MSNYSDYRKNVLAGKVLSISGEWVSMDEAIKEESEVLYNISKRKILSNGEWVSVDELKKEEKESSSTGSIVGVIPVFDKKEVDVATLNTITTSLMGSKSESSLTEESDDFVLDVDTGSKNESEEISPSSSNESMESPNLEHTIEIDPLTISETSDDDNDNEGIDESWHEDTETEIDVEQTIELSRSEIPVSTHDEPVEPNDSEIKGGEAGASLGDITVEDTMEFSLEDHMHEDTKFMKVKNLDSSAESGESLSLDSVSDGFSDSIDSIFGEEEFNLYSRGSDSIDDIVEEAKEELVDLSSVYPAEKNDSEDLFYLSEENSDTKKEQASFVEESDEWGSKKSIIPLLVALGTSVVVLAGVVSFVIFH